MARHLIRRRTRVLAVVFAAAALAVAGCGSTGGVRVAPPAAGAGTDSAADCGDVVLDLTSSGVPHEICLSVGSTVRLRFGPGAQDAGESGGALAEVSAGVYRGAQPGSAELSGTRRACPSRPGQVSCMAIVRWSVTVDVR